MLVFSGTTLNYREVLHKLRDHKVPLALVLDPALALVPDLVPGSVSSSDLNTRCLWTPRARLRC